MIPANSFSKRINFRESGIVAFLLLTVVFFAFTSPNFLTTTSFQCILSSSAIEIVVAAGMAAVIISRQIDLSVGAILGISAYAVGTLLDRGSPPMIAVLLAAVLGALMGAINGAIVTKIRVPAIIATLATATIYRGILFVLAPKILGFMINASQIPSDFRGLSSLKIIGLPFPTVIALVVALIVSVVLASTLWGRNLYAIGSNPEAARFAGIHSDRTIFAAMVLVGALSGLGGFLHVMRFASVNVRTGSGLEFNVIAAVVVGGIAIFGGSGRVFGAVLGVLLLNTLGRGFILMNIPEFWKDVAIGIAIVGAVMTDAFLARRREDMLRWNRRIHLKIGKEEI